MLSMRESEVQEQVRQDRLREAEHQRLVQLVKRQNRSRLQDLVNLRSRKSNHLRQQVKHEALAS